MNYIRDIQDAYPEAIVNWREQTDGADRRSCSVGMFRGGAVVMFTIFPDAWMHYSKERSIPLIAHIATLVARVDPWYDVMEEGNESGLI